MNTRFYAVIAGGVVVLLVLAYTMMFTVNQVEQALVLQFGRPVTPIDQAGLHFKLPYQDCLLYTSNRQGRGDVLPPDQAKRVLDLLREDSERAYRGYVEMLNEDEGAPVDEERQGLARELARMNLTLNFYTQWYWKTDLHNLLNFLSLRADPHAQYEIRVYADAMLDTLEKWVPLTADAFRQHRVGGAQLSSGALALVKKMLAGEKVSQEASGLSKREWTELMACLLYTSRCVKRQRQA